MYYIIYFAYTCILILVILVHNVYTCSMYIICNSHVHCVYIYYLLVPVLAPVVTSPVEPRSRSAPLQWSLPPKEGRNGIITQYILELWVYVTKDREFRSIRNITVPNDRPPNITYLVTGLTPYTRYAWKVAAVNDAGVGVLTSSIDFKTLEDGEEMSLHYYYTNISYNIPSNVSWQFLVQYQTYPTT